MAWSLLPGRLVESLGLQAGTLNDAGDRAARNHEIT